MTGIPLSKFSEVATLVERRKAAVALVERYERLVSVQGYYEQNGTTSEVLPEELYPAIRTLLADHANQKVAALDEQLRAIGVDPAA